MADTGWNLGGLTVVTGLRYASDMLQAYNSMTFLFDENWKYTGNRPVDLPAAFFYVKKCSEVMDSEVSQKTLLFYNTGVTEGSQQGTRMQVVSDNIVAKPKQYKMEIIIPYGNPNPLSMKWGIDTTTMMTLDIAGQSAGQSAGLYNAPSSTVIDLLKDLVQVFTRGLEVYDELFNGDPRELLNEPEYNKNSIEAMWQRRGLVKMKMWNSWRYKTVAITGFEPSKNGTDSNAYEATLTLTEVPIVSFRRTGIPEARKLNTLLQASGALTIQMLSGLEVK